MARHKHAEFIIAWANGEIIEYKSPTSDVWVTPTVFTWDGDGQYRIKPAREWPVSSMDNDDLYDSYSKKINILGHLAALRSVADEAIKRYEQDKENEKI